MKLQTKKIIAREFLLLMLSIGIGLAAFLCTYLYNFYQQTKSQNISNKIKVEEYTADSLVRPFNNKIKQHELFYNQNNEKIDLSGSRYDSPRKLWSRVNDLALKDSIRIKFRTIWTSELKKVLGEIGFDNPEKLQSSIDKNRITPGDSSKYEEAKNIRTKISLLKREIGSRNSKVLFIKSQTEFSFWAFCISIIILFVIRYIFYAVKWSANILRQKVN